MRGLVALLVVALAAAPSTAAASPRPGAVARVVHASVPPAEGPRDALVTIELYFVPGVSSSAVAYREIRALAARHPARVRVLYRPRRLGSSQREPAVALLAHRRGHFFDYLDPLAAPGPSRRSHDVEADLGIDAPTATSALADPAILATLLDNDRRAFRAGVAPALEIVMNGRPVSHGPVRMNASSFTPEQLEAAYQLAWRRARRAAVAGLTGAALREHNRRRGYCDDDDDDGPDQLDGPDPVGDGIDATLGLAALLIDGTDCATPAVRPARIDAAPLGADDRVDEAALMTPRLLEAPLPPPATPMIGPASPEVDVVVVCGLAGPGCRSQLSIFHQLVELYPGRLRLRWLPWLDLDAPDADEDVELAAVALCAAEHGDGWPFSSDPPGLRQRAPDAAMLIRQTGADRDAVLDCAADAGPRVRGLVTAVLAASIRWSPTVVVAGRAYPGGFIDRRNAAIVIEHALAPGLFEHLVR